MASLDELLKLEGVVMAGQFTADGKLTDYRARTDMPPELAEVTAQFCASVSMLFDILAGSFNTMSQMRWTPQQCWSYSGGNWTVVVGANQAVFVETAKANLNHLCKTLSG